MDVYQFTRIVTQENQTMSILGVNMTEARAKNRIPERAASLLRSMEKYRNRYPESKEWTQTAYETLNYIIYSHRADWMNEHGLMD